MPDLTPLAQGVFAWLQSPSRLGVPNAGVVLDTDGATVIDTLTVPSQFEPFGDAVDALGFPVRRVVVTGDHLDFVGGTVRFRNAAVVRDARGECAHLDQPPNPPVLRALHPDLADEIDDEVRTRPVTHVVADATQLTPATFAVPLRGQSLENLVVLVPESDVLFAGALCCFGVTPLAFDGDLAAWADTLDELADLATTIVPGHGPVGGAEDVRALQGYLRGVVAAGGDPDRIGPGPWDGWVGREVGQRQRRARCGPGCRRPVAATLTAPRCRPRLTARSQLRVTARRTARRTTVRPFRPDSGSASASRRNAVASAISSAARPRNASTADSGSRPPAPRATCAGLPSAGSLPDPGAGPAGMPAPPTGRPVERSDAVAELVERERTVERGVGASHLTRRHPELAAG